MAADDGGADDDISQCTQHPFNNTSPGGGICAFCLQDKLGKLVSNSSSSSFLPNSPSSFRSDLPSSSSSSLTGNANAKHIVSGGAGAGVGITPRVPFLNKKSGLVLSRSKSTAHYNNNINNNDYSTPTASINTTPRRRGFWSFLHLPHKKTPPVGPTPSSKVIASSSIGPLTSTSSVQLVVVEEDTDSSPNSSGNGVSNTTSFERKVTRSRSVGCGSRSFSGDLFDRISTGFGDCALRRVESHRHSTSTNSALREKPRCGGLFGGFMMIASTSSSTSTTSSSSYWTDTRPASGRTRSWGWALASPRRVFGGNNKPNGIPKKEIGNGETTTTTTTTTASIATAAVMTTSNVERTTNLADIPSLLSVRN